MAISSAEFLSVANELVGFPASCETHFRAAISRAYYAVYHEALITADHLSLPAVSGGFGEHKKLISRYSSGGKRLKIIADRIEALRAVRVEADYRTSLSVSSVDARKHLYGCKVVLDEVVRLRMSRTASA